MNKNESPSYIDMMKLKINKMLNLKYIIMILSILIYNTVSLHLPGKLRNKFDNMKKKITGLLKAEKGAELFLDIDEFEYPRNNDTLKKIHSQLWEEYYDCLKKQHLESGSEKLLKPSAVMAFEGTSITLNCTLCISPAEVHTIESIDWYYNSTNDVNMTNYPVDITEHTIISADDKALTMYNIETDRAGLYWCTMGDTKSAPYFLHVTNNTEPIIMVKPQEAPNAQHSIPDAIIQEYGLKVYSSWTSWSDCSTCDTVGKRVRYGYCTISMIDNSKDTSTREPKVSKQEETRIEKLIDLAKNSLKLFQNKLPCRSWYTPKELQEIPEVQNRKTEIMTRFCKVKCRRNIIFEVRDNKGNILETANNSAGIYSTIQGMPEPRPAVVRVTVYEIHDREAELKCPGNLNSDSPIVWQIGVKIIDPKTIKSQTKGRISVDPLQRIKFKKVRYADRNVYSCWQRNQLAGTIRLEVTSQMNSEVGKLEQRILMMSCIAIITVLLWVFWRAFQGRRRYTKH